jgi:uncharacterized protein (DUF952 family)
LDREGFIHCSTLEQVIRVANVYFRGQRDLALLCIDPARLQADLRWETPAPLVGSEMAHAQNELFPHIFGAINLDAVSQVVDFPPQADGAFVLPLEVTRS